jgi:hypothetical protein
VPSLIVSPEYLVAASRPWRWQHHLTVAARNQTMSIVAACRIDLLRQGLSASGAVWAAGAGSCFVAIWGEIIKRPWVRKFCHSNACRPCFLMKRRSGSQLGIAVAAICSSGVAQPRMNIGASNYSSSTYNGILRPRAISELKYQSRQVAISS